MRRLAAIVVIALAVGLAVPFALPTLGRWLVVDDPLRPSDAVVVFGGGLPFRALEAAALYKQSMVKEVWLTPAVVRADDRALAELGIERPPEHEYSRQVLIKSGVPSEAIRTLPTRVDNTAKEVRAVVDFLAGDDKTRLILVTSKYHTRRVKLVWQKLAPHTPPPIVRSSSRDPFQPDRWWRSTKDAESVSHEYFGLLNAWMGFPLQPVPSP